MISLIVCVLGALTAYWLWGGHTGLSVLAIVVTLYQASSQNEIAKERQGLQPQDPVQTWIHILASLIIIALFIYSLTV